MRKKLLALLLALALCVSLLPIGAMAADVEYGVFVGETQVTSGNAADVLGNGKVSYDAGSNTLKLDGAVVGSIIFNAVSEDASVEFTGDNTVGGVIVSMGRLTLKGSGTLEIVYDGAEAMTAVAAMSNINFESGTVNIKCANGYSIHTTYDVNVWGTTVVNIDHQADSEAVYVNGTLNVSDRGQLYVRNVNGQNAVKANTLNVSGGRLVAKTPGAQGKALSIGYQLNISGGEVSLDAAHDYAVYADSSVNISGGSLNAYSGGVTSENYAIYAGVYADYDVNITGGVVKIGAESDCAVAAGGEDVNIHDCVFSSNAKAVARSEVGKVNVNNCWLNCSSYGGISTENNVVFTGTAGTVEGSSKAPNGSVVPAGATLTVPEGSTLTVPEGSTLTVEAGATMTNNGKVVIDGTLDNKGTYYENGETEGLVSGGGQMPNNWVVTLDYGFGDVVKYYNVIKGENTTLPDADRSGYAFLGWQCGGESYSAGDSVKVDGNMTFTASWVSHPDSGTFPGFGGSQGGTTESGQPESKPTEPEPKPETPAVDFRDVTASDWYYEAVEYVCAKGLMDGVEEGSFAPDGTLTRAMVWTILARASGVDTDGGVSWYAKAQEWAAAKGVSDGENPDAAITREEFVTMLWRLAGEPVYTADLSRVPDAGSISTWAQQAMCWAWANGLIEGDETGAVSPAASASRAAAATLIMRYLEA